MNTVTKILNIVDIFFPPSVAYAHCDVPCGIYDPKTAQIAAATVLVMTQKLVELKLPADGAVDMEFTKHHNNLVRMIETKEVHAQKCKEELLILWTDFFKKDHLSEFPNLHETFWNAAKLCSKCKQNVDLDAAKALVSSVESIASIFAKIKAAK